MKTIIGILSSLVLVGCVSEPNTDESEQNSAASGVTPTLLSRGTLDPFHVKSDGVVEVELKSKNNVDVITRKHDYQVGSYTGWHQHPGPVIITVTVGTLTFYEADDPTCTGEVVTAGHSFVDYGAGHIGRNESGAPAQDISVIFAPVGLPFRTEINPPGNCPF